MAPLTNMAALKKDQTRMEIFFQPSIIDSREVGIKLTTALVTFPEFIVQLTNLKEKQLVL